MNGTEITKIWSNELWTILVNSWCRLNGMLSYFCIMSKSTSYCWSAWPQKSSVVQTWFQNEWVELLNRVLWTEKITKFIGFESDCIILRLQISYGKSISFGQSSIVSLRYFTFLDLWFWIASLSSVWFRFLPKIELSYFIILPCFLFLGF